MGGSSMAGSSSHSGPTWRELWILGGGFVAGGLTALLVFRFGVLSPAEFLSLALGLGAFVLAGVALFDTRRIEGKVDDLRTSAGSQGTRLEDLFNLQLRQVSAQGGGAIHIPPGQQILESPESRR